MRCVGHLWGKIKINLELNQDNDQYEFTQFSNFVSGNIYI